jgi:hypothetical protein
MSNYTVLDTNVLMVNNPTKLKTSWISCQNLSKEID